MVSEKLQSLYTGVTTSVAQISGAIVKVEGREHWWSANIATAGW